MLALSELFSAFDNTMSVHLRENLRPMAKHGRPGDWKLDFISQVPITKQYIVELAETILEYASYEDNAFIEDDQEHVQVVQLENYRIVITEPPFSDAHEITIVRPTIIRNLDEYNIDKKLRYRLEERAEGILIAGAPGHGKTTFACALANFYVDQNKIVKTIEKPRDLQLDDRVTQFTILPGDIEKTGDILLLIRPDYVIFDEIRKNDDFTVYSDMRLAGVGMVGVIHATKPIDAIQRFVNRVELGVIPNIIDTVIFIQNGELDSVLSLNMVVKKPTGFRDDSLARPVIEVSDFLDGIPLYEIFSFGEQIVVIPINSKYEHPRSNKKRGRKKKNFESKNLMNEIVEILTDEIPGLGSNDISLEYEGTNNLTIYLPKEITEYIVKSYQDRILDLERTYGIYISIKSWDEEINYNLERIEIKEDKKNLVLIGGHQFSNKKVAIMIGPLMILSAQADNNGSIYLSRNKSSTKRLEKLISSADSPLTLKEI